MFDLTDPELRVAGCLIEKQITTPDYYPMTVKALVNACNQATNRQPVVDYDEPTVQGALEALRERGWVRTVRVPGQRSIKYRHVLDEMLELDRPALSLLAVLMLRGAQTPGELRTRTTRYHDFPDLASVETVLDGLATREEPAVERLERRPGEKETRYRHLLGGAGDVDEAGPAGTGEAARRASSLESRVDELERTVERLIARLDALADEMGWQPPAP